MYISLHMSIIVTDQRFDRLRGGVKVSSIYKEVRSPRMVGEVQ